MLNNIRQAAASFFVYEAFCSLNETIPAAADTL